MPTESAFLLAGLLFIAAALGYVFARFGETDLDEEANQKLSTDYLKGLNFVLNEQPDQAVKVFTRMADLDDEALETHFALGSLFRKRGEVDRAIRVHQNLIARPTLSRAQVDQAHAALAEDYLSAGLFDRAESLFEKLIDSSDYQAFALERLVRIYEITREWDQAINVQSRLAKVDSEAATSLRIAHYHCELAEQARSGRDYPAARSALKKADAAPTRTVRSLLILGDIAQDLENFREAAKHYRNVAKQSPSLLVVLIPKLAASYSASEAIDEFNRFLSQQLTESPDAGGAIAMATVIDAGIDDPVAIEALQSFIAEDATLGQLVDVERLAAAAPDERRRGLERVRDALRGIVATRPHFQCAECGYASLTLQWQCPGCRAWETMQPQTSISLLPSY